ncbi:MAG: hypothetical protein QS748_00700 [Candidatus Endonucleobacter bathymodioli]|uniref:Uncharacterized protein n=1 Tax=Candidatus Endonucleibacter bathymodioli TaxID=539814 RepID=A0AA90SLH6_9GAMM|nr:hypothetical protein [Candidatus Endonucleobacter bathymodioli]
MKWCKSFFLVFCCVFASSGFAEPPELADLTKLLCFLRDEIQGEQWLKWGKWAEQNSIVADTDDFSWTQYISKNWCFTEKPLTLEKCNEALRLFHRKKGIERWDQMDLSFVSNTELLKDLLDKVGVRAEISHSDDKYDWAIIPGGALFRVESRIKCFRTLYDKKCVEALILAGSDRRLSKVDNKNELLPALEEGQEVSMLYNLVNKDINTEMDGMFFMAISMLRPDINVESILIESAADLKSNALFDIANNAVRHGCLSVHNIPVREMAMRMSYAKGRDGSRATTMDNVATIYKDNPEIVTKKLALISTQPHAHYQEEIFKKEFNKLGGIKNVDITVCAQPISDSILLVEQLNALHQWLKESLPSS